MSNLAIAQIADPENKEKPQMAYRTSTVLREKSADLIDDYVINIGSHIGMSMDDPCYAFYYDFKSPGICMVAGEHPSIHQYLPWERVIKLMDSQLTPGNVVPFLVKEKTPVNGHFLKIDIDGVDAQILKHMLQRGFEFDIIQIEVNPDFPPTVHFSFQFHPLFKA